MLGARPSREAAIVTSLALKLAGLYRQSSADEGEKMIGKGWRGEIRSGWGVEVGEDVECVMVGGGCRMGASDKWMEDGCLGGQWRPYRKKERGLKDRWPTAQRMHKKGMNKIYKALLA